MMDIYISAETAQNLQNFCGHFKNVIGPCVGILAREEKSIGEKIIPAQDEVGDPRKFYACIRVQSAPEIVDGIEFVDPALGAKIVGVWA